MKLDGSLISALSHWQEKLDKLEAIVISSVSKTLPLQNSPWASRSIAGCTL